MMREVVLDTETTGLRLEDDHRLIEIGVVELEDYVKTGNRFHRYVNPRRHISSEAAQIHGITDSRLKNEKEFRHIADELLQFIGDSKIVIHNAEFDLGFINAELKLARKDPIPRDKVIDTLAMSKKKQPRLRSHSLDALCKQFRIDNSNRTHHGALLDADLLADVYLALLGLDKAVFDLWPEADKAESDNFNDGWKPGPRGKPLASRLTKTEAEEHAALVASLGENALWKRFMPGER
ncbi:MAG: DNA polymerase III subunit epsilon [Albidovulum sp.]|nr:DNA polymerase III subunit epsilon [Albidovulum sp.]